MPRGEFKDRRAGGAREHCAQTLFPSTQHFTKPNPRFHMQPWVPRLPDIGREWALL